MRYPAPPKPSPPGPPPPSRPVRARSKNSPTCSRRTALDLMRLCVHEAVKTYGRRHRRGARGRRLLPLLCKPGARADAAGRAAGADRRAQRAAPGRPRRVGVHRAVEFPARDLPGAGRRRARHRQHRGRQARAADPADRRLGGRARARGGHPRGRAGAAPRRPRGRRGAGRRRARRWRRLHRLDAHRQGDRPHVARGRCAAQSSR